MKRYVVFVYHNYYPDGGWNDLHGLFDTEEEARKSVEGKQYGDYADLVDLELGEEIDSASLTYDGPEWDSERQRKRDEERRAFEAAGGKTVELKATDPRAFSGLPQGFGFVDPYGGSIPLPAVEPARPAIEKQPEVLFVDEWNAACMSAQRLLLGFIKKPGDK